MHSQSNARSMAVDSGAKDQNRSVQSVPSLQAHGSEFGEPITTILYAIESTTGRAPKRSGKGWRSRCPSCGGNSEKVSIAEAENRAVLLHAFCGCAPAAVLGACGLSLGSLFPARLADMTPEGRRAARQAARESGWRAALGVLDVEATVIGIAAVAISRGETLTHAGLERVHVAAGRIHDAREVLR